MINVAKGDVSVDESIPSPSAAVACGCERGREDGRAESADHQAVPKSILVGCDRDGDTIAEAAFTLCHEYQFKVR